MNPRPKPRLPKKLRRVLGKHRLIQLPSKPTSHSRAAWTRFLARVRATKTALGLQENEECWFRGQKKQDALTASLFRLLRHGFNERDNHPQSIYEIEYDLYFESAARGPGLQDSSLNSWDILANMRHHSLPTRLLDWTERLGVAVFFALENHSPDGPNSPVVWMLNPYALNEIGLGDRDLYSPLYLGYDAQTKTYLSYEDYLVHRGGDFDWDLPAAIYPPQKNARMKSQMGWFTVWGQVSGDLDKQCPQCVAKLTLEAEAIPAALDFLSDAGIDYSTIYPDLDGFARMLKTRYGLMAPRPPSK